MTTTQLSIRDRLQSEAFKAAIAEVLPDHVTPERMARTAITAMTRTPDLAKCDQQSFFKCMMDLSQWGLEPDGRHAHLIPFRNNKRNVTECQLIIDYKGLVELAYRSGKVTMIHADVVRQGDLFTYDMGHVKRHVPHFLRTDTDRPKDAGEIIAAYCVVELKGGTTKCEVMSLDEIDAIRKRSRAGSSGPWQTDWNEMAKKTVFRRVSKWIPLSADVRDAFDRSADMTIESHAVTRTKADVLARLDPMGYPLDPAEDKSRTSEPQEASTAAPAVEMTWEEAIAAETTAEGVYAILGEIDDSGLSDDAKRDLGKLGMDRIEELNG